MKKFSMACMVHNAYTYYVERYIKSLNGDVDTFGSSMSYFYDQDDLKENYDFIILFSTGFYSPLEEARIKGVVEAIREKEKKDVTTAYLYAIPEAERKENKTDGVKIEKVTDDGTIIRSFDVESDYDVLDLINDALEFGSKELQEDKLLMKDLVNKEV